MIDAAPTDLHSVDPPDVPSVPTDTPVDARLDASTEVDRDSGPNSFQVFSDRRWRDGFMTYPATPTTVPSGEIVPPTAMAPPTWSLAEWNTAGLLSGPPTTVPAGAQWANIYKRLVVADGFLELAVNSDAEYGGTYRNDGEGWPHLLVSQQIYESNELTREIPLHQYTRLELSLSLEMAYMEPIRNEAEGYDPNIHACQFLFFITVQNRNTSHPDYGNFIWIGLPFYDDRDEFVEEGSQVEMGLGKTIFRMAARDFMPASLHTTPNVDVRLDLAPFMREKLEEAIRLGNLESGDLNDYYLGGMNMGFELPGRCVSTVRVRDLSLMAERE